MLPALWDHLGSTARPQNPARLTEQRPEGSRVEITGSNLESATLVLFRKSPAAFKPVSDEKLIALVPRWASKATISVMTSTGRATSPVAFLVRDDPRNP